MDKNTVLSAVNRGPDLSLQTQEGRDGEVKQRWRYHVL
jgi:hypothetical protein